jgi:NADH-ubiquinone oxidoreductase chain 6
MKSIFIDMLALTTLLSAVLVITSKNPVISIVYLIVTFVFASAFLILSGIIFIGISYIIIYVGAIAVIFLFVIMMINIKITDILESGRQYTKNFPLAIAIGSLFMYELYNILPFTLNNSVTFLLDIFNNLNRFLLHTNNYNMLDKIFITYCPNNYDINFTTFLQIQAIGQSIYTYDSILLIILSIILLLAMVAPIFISRFKNNNIQLTPFIKLSNNNYIYII